VFDISNRAQPKLVLEIEMNSAGVVERRNITV